MVSQMDEGKNINITALLIVWSLSTLSHIPIGPGVCIILSKNRQMPVFHLEQVEPPSYQKWLPIASGDIFRGCAGS